MFVNVATLAYHLDRRTALDVFHRVEHTLGVEIKSETVNGVTKRSFDLCKAILVAELDGKSPFVARHLYKVANALRIKVC